MPAMECDKKPVHVYVDVDGTLVTKKEEGCKPIKSVIQHVRSLFDQGAILHCWSTGGTDHARQAAGELGIADCFKEFLAKPNIFIDDESSQEWPECIHVKPDEACETKLDEYRRMIESKKQRTEEGRADDKGNAKESK